MVKVLGTSPHSSDRCHQEPGISLYQAEPSGEVEFKFADSKKKSGEHYYYVRVQQEEGNVAWSSPIWVTIQ